MCLPPLGYYPNVMKKDSKVYEAEFVEEKPHNDAEVPVQQRLLRGALTGLVDEGVKYLKDINLIK